MLTVQYCSDLHLEFPENDRFLKENPLIPRGDILLLAGDIVPFAILEKKNDFFNFLADNFEAVYWVPGNHEYYHDDAALKTGRVNEKIRTNVFLVNNVTILQSGFNFIFSTLWSKINPATEWSIRRSLSDFKVIKFDGKPFTPFQYNHLHEECLAFIEEAVAHSNPGKTMMITHHVPSFLNYPEKYKGDILNEAFAVELHPFIESCGIPYWIYGHHHNNIPDFEIGKTQLLTNQLGYVQFNENQLFDPGKRIQLGA